MAKKATCTSEQLCASERLAACKDEVAALKHDLAEARVAAPSTDRLLTSGLRLAMENEALHDKIAQLTEAKGGTTKANSAAETSLPI